MERPSGRLGAAEHEILIDAHSEFVSTTRDSTKPLDQPSVSDPTTRGSTISRKERREPMPTTSATLRPATCQVDESSDEELNIKEARQVTYRERDGMPGLSL